MDTAVGELPLCGIRTTIRVSVLSPLVLSVRSSLSTLSGSGLPCASVRLSLPTSSTSRAPSSAGGAAGCSASTSAVLSRSSLPRVFQAIAVTVSTAAETSASTLRPAIRTTFRRTGAPSGRCAVSPASSTCTSPRDVRSISQVSWHDDHHAGESPDRTGRVKAVSVHAGHVAGGDGRFLRFVLLGVLHLLGGDRSAQRAVQPHDRGTGEALRARALVVRAEVDRHLAGGQVRARLQGQAAERL